MNQHTYIFVIELKNNLKTENKLCKCTNVNFIHYIKLFLNATIIELILDHDCS